MSEVPRRGRARRLWLQGYAEARRLHYTKTEDGLFATLEDLSPDEETLYRVDMLRLERDTGTGHYAPHLRERMGLGEYSNTEESVR